jgi:hypothetical protein
MNPTPITQTLLQLISERDNLNKLIAGLEDYQMAVIGRAEAKAMPLQMPSSTAAREAQEARPKKARAAAKPVKAARHTGRSATSGQRALEIARKIVEPFGPSDLAVALGATPKNASNFIQRWKRKGWVVNGPTYGTCQRTKTFGGPGASSKAILDEIHAEIEAAKPKED